MSDTLLIIEDNEQNFYMMRFLLEKNGFTVIGANTGREGIEKALRIKPDAILLDIQLPEMDGYAVAEELKRHEALQGNSYHRGNLLRDGWRPRTNFTCRCYRLY